MRKLDDKRYGPFTILEKVGRSAYRLKLPATWKVHNVFNEVLLTPYIELSFPTQQKPLPPPPEIINNVPKYIVEQIKKAKLE